MDSAKTKKITRVDQDIYLTPKEGKHTETLVFMHGLGDTADGWLDAFISSSSPVLEVSHLDSAPYD